MKKILIYSDCFVYSGSENVLENILRSEDIPKEYSLDFYYAYNKEYEKGIKRKFSDLTNVKPFRKLINPYPQWGHPLSAGTIKGTFPRLYIKTLYTIGLILNKVGILRVYNGFSLMKLFKRERPDILLINNGGYPAAESCRTAVISARLAGIRQIVFVVNNMAYPPKNFFDRTLDKYIRKYVSYFVTASRAASERLAEVRGFDQQQCINIPNTLLKEVEKGNTSESDILRSEFAIDKDTIALGAVGLLTLRKGYHVLIAAMAILKEQFPAVKYKLVILGEGEERTALEALIAQHGLQDMVVLPGFRPNVMEYVKGMDIFVAPSIANEDFPYVIIEAMMMGKPVIGSRVAGIPEQIDDQHTGYVVQPGVPEDLANAIHKMSDKDSIASMGLRSRQRYFDNFCNDLVMKRYLELFRSLK